MDIREAFRRFNSSIIGRKDSGKGTKATECEGQSSDKHWASPRVPNTVSVDQLTLNILMEHTRVEHTSTFVMCAFAERLNFVIHFLHGQALKNTQHLC